MTRLTITDLAQTIFEAYQGAESVEKRWQCAAEAALHALNECAFPLDKDLYVVDEHGYIVMQSPPQAASNG